MYARKLKKHFSILKLSVKSPPPFCRSIRAATTERSAAATGQNTLAVMTKTRMDLYTGDFWESHESHSSCILFQRSASELSV